MGFPHAGYCPFALPIGEEAKPSFIFWNPGDGSAPPTPPTTLYNNGAFQPANDKTAFAWSAEGVQKILLASKSGPGSTFLSIIATPLRLTAIPAGSENSAEILFRLGNGDVKYLQTKTDFVTVTQYRLRLSLTGIEWAADTPGPGPNPTDLTGSGAAPQLAMWTGMKTLGNSYLYDVSGSLGYLSPAATALLQIRQTGPNGMTGFTLVNDSSLSATLLLQDSIQTLRIASNQKLALSSSGDMSIASAANIILSLNTPTVNSSTASLLVRRISDGLVQMLAPANADPYHLVARGNVLQFEAIGQANIGSGHGGYLAVWSGLDGQAGSTTLGDVPRGSENSHFLRNQITSPPVFDAIAFADITATPTTLAGYGITNAYTKTETDNKFALKFTVTAPLNLPAPFNVLSWTNPLPHLSEVGAGDVVAQLGFTAEFVSTKAAKLPRTATPTTPPYALAVFELDPTTSRRPLCHMAFTGETTKFLRADGKFEPAGGAASGLQIKGWVMWSVKVGGIEDIIVGGDFPLMVRNWTTRVTLFNHFDVEVPHAAGNYTLRVSFRMKPTEGAIAAVPLIDRDLDTPDLPAVPVLHHYNVWIGDLNLTPPFLCDPDWMLAEIIG